MSKSNVQKYLDTISDEDLIQILQDMDELHNISGYLPLGSKLRDLKSICYKEMNNASLVLAEEFIKWEVFKRFKQKYEQTSRTRH